MEQKTTIIGITYITEEYLSGYNGAIDQEVPEGITHSRGLASEVARVIKSLVD